MVYANSVVRSRSLFRIKGQNPANPSYDIDPPTHALPSLMRTACAPNACTSSTLGFVSRKEPEESILINVNIPDELPATKRAY